jgi:hypothetical protein
MVFSFDQDNSFSQLTMSFLHKVYNSKPPSYRRVHSLRYNPSNRPKRNPPSDETCECKSNGLSICDEHCFNRLEMIECIGDVNKNNGAKNKYWNCNLGPLDP